MSGDQPWAVSGGAICEGSSPTELVRRVRIWSSRSGGFSANIEVKNSSGEVIYRHVTSLELAARKWREARAVLVWQKTDAQLAALVEAIC